AEDFKAGQCDGVAITGLRGRSFNPYVGSIDSIGAVPSYKHLRTVIQVLASPQSEASMKRGEYEVVGIIPLGAAYVFVRDRSINSIEKAAGKKIAVLDFDKSQARMVQQLGAQPVASDITNFIAKFNNGQVDIVAAPGIAYKPFEMYKGLSAGGAVYRFPLAQLTANMLIRSDKFPAGFGQKSRQYVLGQIDQAQR
ncbi:MAG: putative solute-binding protein, partial [Perlucidibaca sp.]